MIMSIKKYVLMLKTLKTLTSRPYLADISEFDGVVTFTFVKDDKTYQIQTIKITDERIMN